MRQSGSIFDANQHKWVSEAYKWADRLCFETNLTEIGDAFRMSAGTTSEGLLSPETWAELKGCWLAAYPELSSTPPWHIALHVPSIGNHAVDGVDSQLTRRAVEDQKRIDYLETPAEFRAHMDAVPVKDWEALIVDELREIRNNRRNLQAMYSDWSRRSLDGLYKRFQKQAIYTVPALNNAVLTARNKAWVPHVERFCGSEDRTLVVVGSLHLTQKDNLLELMGRPFKATGKRS